MSNIFWLTEAQMARLEPFFPKSQVSHASMIVVC
jgi:hypothetical protein